MGGGQTKTLSHFVEIRKQLIWGNTFIMFKNKSLMFDNWINIFKPPISQLPIIVFLLTLSGLPSHMNLKHLLSISFLCLSGTTHALATKVNIGMTNALIIM
jgi:hypothetical protein